jgi:hypothetical protein
VLAWHALLAPLPSEAVVSRTPVTPPDRANDPSAAAIAGWDQLTVELSAGRDGLRHLLVVLDATGRPISAGDHVLTIRELSNESGGAPLNEYVHDSLGGRIEADGTFNGTRWHMVRVLAPDEDAGDEDPPSEARSAKPTEEEVSAIKVLVAEILRRAGETRAP